MASSAIHTTRRRFLGGSLLLTTGLTTAAVSPSAMRTYYVSADGSDTANGLAENTAWATIEKVNAAAATGSLILFRRGDWFYGELTVPKDSKVAAYGNGDAPVLSMYKVLNRAQAWVRAAPGIWSIDLASSDTHGGYFSTTKCNIGFLLVDGYIKPSRKSTLADVNALWDFWCDEQEGVLYVSVDANPTSIATDIKAAARGDSGAIVNCKNGGNEIYNIRATGSGGHGIVGASSDVHIHNCVIDCIGGSYLPGFRDGRVRYGNGIENGIGAKRWLVENNEISQTYDVAYTCQGTAVHGDETWEDITVRGNVIHHCTQTFEFWSKGRGPSSGYRRVLIEGNLCQFAGNSVFADERPNQMVRVHLLTYDWELAADILLTRNVFHGASTAYSFHQTIPQGLVAQENLIRLHPQTRLQLQMQETVEQAAEWQAATGREAASRFEVVA